MSRDPRDRRSAEEIAREHARIQREIEGRTPTEGGLTGEDLKNVAGEQQGSDHAPFDPDALMRGSVAYIRQELEREDREDAEKSADDPPADAPSILDSVEPRDAKSALAEAFGGGAAGRSVQEVRGGRSRDLVMRVAALGIGLAGVFILWQALQGQTGGTQPTPTFVPATATALTQPTRSASPTLQPTSAPTATTGIGIVCGLPGGPSCPPRP